MKFPLHSTLRSDRKAFTIIELLVAVGVTALMVSLMLTIVVNVLGGWNRSSGSLSSGNQARLVLDQIGRDLQSAIIKRDGNGWMVAHIQQGQSGVGSAGITDANWSPTVPKPDAGGGNDPSSLTTSFVIPAVVAPSTVPAIDDYRFGQGGVWLRFFTTSPDTNSTGDLHRISAPRAVAYQIVRLPVVASSDEVRYQLFRSEVRPGHANAALAARSTFAVGYNLLDPASLYNVPSTTNSGVFINSGVDEGGEPGSIRRPDRNQLIANNIIDFGVRFWARNAAGVLEIAFPKTVSDTSFAATSDTAAAVTSRGFPEVAEVFVRVLTDEGVTQIANLEAGLTPDSAGKWWEIALANSRVYTRRVDIKANSL